MVTPTFLKDNSVFFKPLLHTVRYVFVPGRGNIIGAARKLDPVFCRGEGRRRGDVLILPIFSPGAQALN
jgi:hypothetical protein